MLELTVLGIIQGIAEWLPISSEGFLFLAKTTFFSGGSVGELVRLALFLHLGTFLAALVYFRKEVWQLVKALFQYRKSGPREQKLLVFLIVSTAVSGGVGIGVLYLVEKVAGAMNLTGTVLTGIVAVLLIVTGILQLKTKEGGKRMGENLTLGDGIILGLVQAMAVLPGLSRSGFTVAALLLRKFGEETALRLSFLMSLPIVLGGNILLNLTGIEFSLASMLGVAAAFIFGFLTIDMMMRVARNVSFAWFTILFGILTAIAVFI